MRFKFLMTLVAVLMLAACAPKWTNPNIADPRTEDTMREDAIKFCQQESMDKVPVAGRNSPQMEVSFSDVITVNEAQDRLDQRRAGAFEKCMRTKGWIPIQED